MSRSAKVLGPGFEATDKPAAVVDVIDIATHKVIKSVRVHNTVHNMFITPDDSEVIAGLRGEVEPGEPAFQIIDPKTDTVAWGMELTGHTQYGKTHHEVRPMAFEAGADGTTTRAYAQATGINVVFVIDWKARKVVDLLRRRSCRSGNRMRTASRPATCTDSKCCPIDRRCGHRAALTAGSMDGACPI